MFYSCCNRVRTLTISYVRGRVLLSRSALRQRTASGELALIVTCPRGDKLSQALGFELPFCGLGGTSLIQAASGLAHQLLSLAQPTAYGCLSKAQLIALLRQLLGLPDRAHSKRGTHICRPWTNPHSLPAHLLQTKLVRQMLVRRIAH